MIEVKQTGSFKNTERYLQRLQANQVDAILHKYGVMGVNALSANTPEDTGETAASWYYTIKNRPGYYSIRWHNRHEDQGIPVAVLIQYGHGTRSGSLIPGNDFIMPAVKPIFEQITREVWEEVTKI